MSLRVRGHDPHRRGPHRAAGHRAGEASGHRHGAPEVRVPKLRARGSPGRRAGAPHRGRIADRGGAGAGTHFQVCGSPSAVPSVSDLRPLGREARPFHARRLGGQGVLSPHPGGGSAGLAPEAVGTSVHGRDPGRRCWTRAGARPKRGTCGRWPAISGPGPVRTRPAWCSSTRPVAADIMPSVFSRASKASCTWTGMPATTRWRRPARGWFAVTAGRTPGASSARSTTATARPSPPKGCGVSPGCTPSRSRSGASRPRSGSPCARPAPRR